MCSALSFLIQERNVYIVRYLARCSFYLYLILLVTCSGSLAMCKVVQRHGGGIQHHPAPEEQLGVCVVWKMHTLYYIKLSEEWFYKVESKSDTWKLSNPLWIISMSFTQWKDLHDDNICEKIWPCDVTEFSVIGIM